MYNECAPITSKAALTRSKCLSSNVRFQVCSCRFFFLGLQWSSLNWKMYPFVSSLLHRGTGSNANHDLGNSKSINAIVITTHAISQVILPHLHLSLRRHSGEILIFIFASLVWNTYKFYLSNCKKSPELPL